MWQDVVIDDIPHGRVGGGTGQHIAAKGRTMVARLEHGGVMLGQYRADGHTATEALGQADDVGFDPKCLIAKQGAQTADSGLNLIKNQE